MTNVDNSKTSNKTFWLVFFFCCIGMLFSCNSSDVSKSDSTFISEEPVEKISEPKNWGYSTEADEMTSKNTYTAVVTSNNLQEFDFPYNGGVSGHLTLRKHPRYGKDVIFSVDKGQILCHSYGDCSITVRFDKKPPITLAGNPPEDNSSTHVFLPYQRLFKLIKSSKIMLIEANFYQEGNRSFEFDTSKLSWSS